MPALIIINPNGTVSQTDVVGDPSFNLHENLDGMSWPGDGDLSSWVRMNGPDATFKIRMANYAVDHPDKTWVSGKTRIFIKKAVGEGSGPSQFRVVLTVGGEPQFAQLLSPSSETPTSVEVQFPFTRFNFSQAEYDTTEVEFFFTFYGGDVEILSYQIEVFQAFLDFADGGAVLGGNAGVTVFRSEIPEGGAVLNGLALVGGTSTAEGSGGALLNGLGLPSTTHNTTVDGGMLVGGIGVVASIYTKIPSGGAIVSPNFDLEFTGVGGVDIAGVAGGRASYNYNILNTDNDVQIGGSAFIVINLALPAGGEVVVNGAAELRANYIYNASGGINVEGTVGFSISRIDQKNFTFSVRTKQTIEAPFLFNWNTGSIPINFYRIISRCEPEDPEKCSPISDPEDLCNRKAVVVLSAPTPASVCSQLTERGFRFSIDEFDQFTRPAENVNLVSDTASGDFDSCNTLVPIEFCTIPECLEFCIDFDLFLLIKPIIEFDFTQVKEYTGDGLLVIGGCADIDFVINNSIFNDIGRVGITSGGFASISTPVNRYIATGGLSVEGTAGGDGVKSSVYQYSSGICPDETPLAFLSVVNQEGVGGSWIDENRVFANDGIKAYAQLSSTQKTKSLVIVGANLNIPEDKLVSGIAVEIQRDGGPSPVAFDYEIVLVGPNDIISENKAKADIWDVEQKVIYGGGNDVWDRAWTPEEINSDEFGVSITVASGSEISQNVFIDAVRISIGVCEPDGSGLFKISGSAIQKVSSYVVEGTGSISVSGGLTSLAEYAYEAVGGISITGSYAQSLTSGIVGTSDTGQMEVGGGLTPTDFKSSVYNYDNYGGTTGGAIVSSEFISLNIVSSGWSYAGTEGPTISGSANFRVGYIYEGDDTPILITGGFGQNFFYVGNGTLRVGPEFEQAVTPIFSRLAFDYNTAGGVEIGASGAFIRFADLGTFDVDVKANFILSEINAVFGAVDVDVGTTLVPVDTVLTTCGRGCLDLPLIIDMNHNLVQDNKLSQFLFRNNLVMDSVIPLNYNKPNDCWQANLHFNGIGNSGNLESWNIVFELACSSFVSGVELGQPMLRFGVSVIQKNLVTGEDYDTRVLSIFDPLSVCQRDIELIFKLTIDSKLVTTLVSPESTVQDTIVHDNIGLFKTGFWFENPDIIFNVSEVGTQLPARRIDITPLVNY